MRKLSSTQASYHTYLQSKEWKREKAKAWKWSTKCCTICYKRYGLEWHHYRGYKAIWTLYDHKYIVPVCHLHHTVCHYKWFGAKKIPLTSKALYTRYYRVKRGKWRRIRPSSVGNFILKIYGT